jgi:hypothetical protein
MRKAVDFREGHWGIVQFSYDPRMPSSYMGGFVTLVGEAPLVQVDVPKTEEEVEFTRVWGPGEVGSIIACSEEEARLTAEHDVWSAIPYDLRAGWEDGLGERNQVFKKKPGFLTGFDGGERGE